MAKRKRGPLSWGWVVVYAVLAGLIGVGVTKWSWPPEFPMPTDDKDKVSAVAERTKAQSDAIRTGLTAAGGAGAVFTLLLAVRRQRSTEEADAAAQHDAEQRRVTELYTAAVEQLGHDSAAVRLGALYALQRLGKFHPDQREAIVNVWCAYLRMPFDDPAIERRQIGLNTFTPVAETERAALNQELQVRLTVQRLLREHAHSGASGEDSDYWGDKLDVDLTGATLYKLDLGGFQIHPHTDFSGATFIGGTRFDGATFIGDARFDGATFSHETIFDGATFLRRARFLRAVFSGNTVFQGATFTREAMFSGTTFNDAAWFDDATFADFANFARTTFRSEVWFDGATFASAHFGAAAFINDASFASVVITRSIRFNRAVARSGDQLWPVGWIWQPDADLDVPDGGDPDATWGRLVRIPAESEAGPDEPTEDAPTPA